MSGFDSRCRRRHCRQMVPRMKGGWQPPFIPAAGLGHSGDRTGVMRAPQALGTNAGWHPAFRQPGFCPSPSGTPRAALRAARIACLLDRQFLMAAPRTRAALHSPLAALRAARIACGCVQVGDPAHIIAPWTPSEYWSIGNAPIFWGGPIYPCTPRAALRAARIACLLDRQFLMAAPRTRVALHPPLAALRAATRLFRIAWLLDWQFLIAAPRAQAALQLTSPVCSAVSATSSAV